MTRKASDLRPHDLAFGLVCIEQNFGELFGPAHARIFHQNMVGLARLCLQVQVHLRRAAARSLMTVPFTCGIRAAGVPGRGE